MTQWTAFNHQIFLNQNDFWEFKASQKKTSTRKIKWKSANKRVMGWMKAKRMNGLVVVYGAWETGKPLGGKGKIERRKIKTREAMAPLWVTKGTTYPVWLKRATGLAFSGDQKKTKRKKTTKSSPRAVSFPSSSFSISFPVPLFPHFFLSEPVLSVFLSRWTAVAFASFWTARKSTQSLFSFRTFASQFFLVNEWQIEDFNEKKWDDVCWRE